MKTKDAIISLTALAQESRLAIFKLLVKTGPNGISASNIGEELAIPASSLSFHLKELSRANLITPLQQGRFIIYSANFHEMNDLIEFLTENCCGQASGYCSPSKSRKKT
jgi:DNA-binding transcriptional ArsR family regulator